MTTETFYEREEPIEAFLHGARLHVRDTLRAYERERTEETYEAWLRAAELYRRHEVGFFGIECPEVQPVSHDGCETCMGAGEVLPHEAIEFYEAHGLSIGDALQLVEAA